MLIPTYGYANARVKARKTKLLTKEKLKQLTALKSLPEVIELLEETPYKQFFIDASTKYANGLELVNQALNASLVADLQKVFQIWPTDLKSKELRKLLLEEWTIQNAKVAIASAATNLQLNKTDLLGISTLQKDLVEKLLTSQSMEKTLAALSDSRFGISKIIHKLKRENPSDFRTYFKAFDNYYLQRLFENATTQKDHHVSKLLLAKAKTTLVLSILRLKANEYKNNEIENAINLPKRYLNSLKAIIDEENFEKAVEKTFKAFHVKKEVTEEYEKTKSLAFLEAAIEKTAVEKDLKTARVAVFSPAVILGYIYAKQAEIATIKAICYSTQAGISSDVRRFINI